MIALLREIRALPLTEGILAVRVLADAVVDGFCLARTDTSPGVDVAVVYDGSDRHRGEAKGYARVLSGAPAMLKLLTGVLAEWGEAVEADTPIEGVDAVQWLAEFTIDVREVLQAITGAVQPIDIEIHAAEISGRVHPIARSPELLSLLRQARAALPDAWAAARCNVPRRAGRGDRRGDSADACGLRGGHVTIHTPPATQARRPPRLRRIELHIVSFRFPEVAGFHRVGTVLVRGRMGQNAAIGPAHDHACALGFGLPDCVDIRTVPAPRPTAAPYRLHQLPGTAHRRGGVRGRFGIRVKSGHKPKPGVLCGKDCLAGHTSGLAVTLNSDSLIATGGAPFSGNQGWPLTRAPEHEGIGLLMAIP